MKEQIIKALRTPIAKFISRAVLYGLGVVYAAAGIDVGQVETDAAGIVEVVVAGVSFALAMAIDYAHHIADKADMPNR
jgi:acetyl-CoA acetyltransferase